MSQNVTLWANFPQNYKQNKYYCGSDRFWLSLGRLYVNES